MFGGAQEPQARCRTGGEDGAGRPPSWELAQQVVIPPLARPTLGAPLARERCGVLPLRASCRLWWRGAAAGRRPLSCGDDPRVSAPRAHGRCALMSFAHCGSRRPPPKKKLTTDTNNSRAAAAGPPHAAARAYTLMPIIVERARGGVFKAEQEPVQAASSSSSSPPMAASSQQQIRRARLGRRWRPAVGAAAALREMPPHG
jgi:hypothetical protein